MDSLVNFLSRRGFGPGTSSVAVPAIEGWPWKGGPCQCPYCRETRMRLHREKELPAGLIDGRPWCRPSRNPPFRPQQIDALVAFYNQIDLWMEGTKK